MLENERESSQILSNEEIQEQFCRLGIKAVLFDLDDTLIFTTEIFRKYMQQYVEKVALETDLDLKTLNESLSRHNDESYKKLGVNPAKWSNVVENMAKEFPGYENSIIENLEILMNIYIEEPRIRSGAKETLAAIRKAGIKIGIVTHANESWTWRKLASTGLAESYDVIKIANEDGHKGVKDWETAMENLDVLPTECLVIGDSIGGDIIPSKSLGAKAMWITNGSTWSIYQKGEIPENTVSISEVDELLSALVRLG